MGPTVPPPRDCPCSFSQPPSSFLQILSASRIRRTGSPFQFPLHSSYGILSRRFKVLRSSPPLLFGGSTCWDHDDLGFPLATEPDKFASSALYKSSWLETYISISCMYLNSVHLSIKYKCFSRCFQVIHTRLNSKNEKPCKIHPPTLWKMVF